MNQASCLSLYHQCLPQCLTLGRCLITMWVIKVCTGGTEPDLELISRLQCLEKTPHFSCKSSCLEYLWVLVIDFPLFH